MKKTIISIILILCTAISLQAQTQGVNIGKTIDGDSVMAEKKELPYPIYQINGGNSNTMAILMAVKETSAFSFSSSVTSVSALDKNTKEIRWTVEKKGVITNARPTCHGILINHSNKTIMLDDKDGHERWSIKLYPTYMNDSLDIIMGYKTNATSDSKLKAYRLSTGQMIWETKVKHSVSWGWNDAQMLPDKRILVVADDINVINIQTGALQTYDAKTGFSDVKSSILMGLAMAAGAVAGAAIAGGVGGYYYIPTYGQNVINGLSSNILQMDSCYFIVDRNELRCFNSDMQMKWTYSYPTEKASASILYGEHNTVYMLNFGYGLRNGNNKVKHSKPFIASFNALTGEPFFFNTLKMKKDIVEDAFIAPWESFILFDDGMAYQRDINDSVITITPWNTKEHGELVECLHNTAYVYNEGTHSFEAIAYDGHDCPVFTSTGELMIIDKDLNISKRYDTSTLYGIRFKKDDYACIRKRVTKNLYRYWFIQEAGLPIIEFTSLFNDMEMMGNDVFLVEGNNLLFFELVR
ncbi:MAG: PQQ-binding-like beta-propeller repeat protein [Prevotella sp.]|nr:PQQ-binding-like beta-propeller repeat protein [Prevotella sp.]